MSAWPLRTATRHALDSLGECVDALCRLVPTPEFQGESERQWWRFPNEGPLELAIVKLARVTSGLNAIAVLLEKCYTVEAMALLRTVDDFVDEVTFVLEAVNRDSPTNPQAAFLKAFFEEVVPKLDELLKDQRGPDRVKKRQIRAAQGRYLDEANPDGVRRKTGAIDKTFNGYVHGSYPHSMELWRGDAHGNGEFMLQGTVGAPYAESYWRQHAHYVSRVLSVAGMVALHAGRQDISDRAKAARDRFEASPEYPGGDG